MERLNRADRFLDGEPGFVVFGSAAIVLRGVKLGRMPSDLDLFASETAFDRLGRRLPIRQRKGKDQEDVLFVRLADDIEVLKSFPAITYDEAALGSKVLPLAGRIPVANLETLMRWKQAQGRAKDLQDIDCIKRFLAALPKQPL